MSKSEVSSYWAPMALRSFARNISITVTLNSRPRALCFLVCCLVLHGQIHRSVWIFQLKYKNINHNRIGSIRSRGLKQSDYAVAVFDTSFSHLGKKVDVRELQQWIYVEQCFFQAVCMCKNPKICAEKVEISWIWAKWKGSILSRVHLGAPCTEMRGAESFAREGLNAKTAWRWQVQNGTKQSHKNNDCSQSWALLCFSLVFLT